MDREHIERAIKTFPLLGLLQGLLYSALLYAMLNWTPLSQLAASFVIWLALIVVTGGIHLDGWMDASDAFFSYRDREKRLEIMKDPRIGAFGVLSVLVLLSARFLFIYEIVERAVDISYVLIMLIPFMSKSMMGVLLIKVRAAKEDGLGTLFKKAATKYTLWIYPIYMVLVFGGILILWPEAVNGFLVLLMGTGLFLLMRPEKSSNGLAGLQEMY